MSFFVETPTVLSGPSLLSSVYKNSPHLQRTSPRTTTSPHPFKQQDRPRSDYPTHHTSRWQMSPRVHNKTWFLPTMTTRSQPIWLWNALGPYKYIYVRSTMKSENWSVSKLGRNTFCSRISQTPSMCMVMENSHPSSKKLVCTGTTKVDRNAFLQNASRDAQIPTCNPSSRCVRLCKLYHMVNERCVAATAKWSKSARLQWEANLPNRSSYISVQVLWLIFLIACIKQRPKFITHH